MEFEKGERVMVRRHGPGEVVGSLSDSCVTVKLDRGGTMHVHHAGVKREKAKSESHFRSKE